MPKRKLRNINARSLDPAEYKRGGSQSLYHRGTLLLSRSPSLWESVLAIHIPAEGRWVWRGGTQFPSHFSTLPSLTTSSSELCKDLCLKPPSGNPSLRKTLSESTSPSNAFHIGNISPSLAGQPFNDYIDSSFSSNPVKNVPWPSFFTPTLRVWLESLMASHTSAKGFYFSVSIPYQ